MPASFGIGRDERCVEYPWVISQLPPGPGLVLDAGSALNQDYIISHSSLSSKTLHILTLGPEEACFWRKGISYIYADLRNTPLKDEFYDTVVSVSTIEHIGFDNTEYLPDDRYRENRPTDFVVAMREMRRVLRPGGTLLVTMPYGISRPLKTAQVFDASILRMAIEAFEPVSPRRLVLSLFVLRLAGFQRGGMRKVGICRMDCHPLV